MIDGWGCVPEGTPRTPQRPGTAMAERTVDIVLRGGTVVDGTGQPPFRADVAIDKGLIVGVEEDGSPGDGGGRGGAGPWRGRREIDCRGKTIAPGFVDLHTHYGPTPTPLPPSCSRPSPSPHPIPRPHHPVSHLHPALSSGGGRRRADDVGSVPLALERRRRYHSDRRKLRRRLCRARPRCLFTVPLAVLTDGALPRSRAARRTGGSSCN